MPINIKKKQTARTTKKIIVFMAIVWCAIIAVAVFAVPSAKATYLGNPDGEREKPIVTAGVSEDIVLDNTALRSEIIDVTGTPIVEAPDEAKNEDQSKKDSIDNQANRKKTDGVPAGDTVDRARDNGNSNQSASGGQNGSTEKKTQKKTSTAPVKRSQTAPYYYHHALKAAEKRLYTVILDGLTNVSPKIALGENQDKDQICNAFYAVVRDRTDLFWVGFGYVIHTNTVIIDGSPTITYVMEPFYTMSAAQASSAKSKLDSAVNNVLKILHSGMSKYDMELAVHDYIIKKVTYSAKALQDPKSYPNAYTAYGALVEGSAVCEGYAKAFHLILNKVGVQTIVVPGRTSGGAHMWNMANIGGDWYHVDVTFDDPNNKNPDAVLRNYFNLSAAEIGKTHVIYDNLSQPAANAMSKNFFKAEGLSFSAYDDKAADTLYNEVIHAMQSNNSVAQIRVGGNMSSVRSVLQNPKARNSLSNIKTAAQKMTGKKFFNFKFSTDGSYGIITVYLGT